MEDETEDGWTIRMAGQRLLSESDQQIIASALWAAEIGGDVPRVSHYRPKVWAFLVKRVSSGEVIATGFPPDGTRRQRINPDVVQHAEPDFEKTELKLGNAVWTGVRLRLVVSGLDQTADEPGLGVSPAFQWMREHAKASSKIDPTVKDCMNATGATFRECRKAWKALPDDVRGRPGAHK